MRRENRVSAPLFRQAGIFALLLFIVAGCATGIRAQKLPPILGEGPQDPSAFNAQAIKELKGQYDRTVLSANEADRKLATQLRNRLIGIGVDQIDALYFDKLKGDRKKIRLVQFILDFLEIGAATAISITNGERAKTIISEGLGALQSSRTSLNKNFQLLERQVLINRMEADRAIILARILGKLNQSAVEYPWELASADLRAYRDAGTLDSALSSLSANVGRERTNAEENLREVKDQPITGAASEEDEALAKKAFKARAELKHDLEIETSKKAALQKLQSIVKKLENDDEIAGKLTAEGVSSATAPSTAEDGTKILTALRHIRTQLLKDNRRDLIRKIDRITADPDAQ